MKTLTREDAKQWTMTLRDEIERGDIYAAISTAATLNESLVLTVDIHGNSPEELKAKGWEDA